MNWKAFQQAAPRLAGVTAERLTRSGVALLGTLRRDGSPRISPVEPLLTQEELLVGLMWHSTKALDLLRDPRCTLHSAIASLEGTEGECKLGGRATEAADPVARVDHQRIFREHWGADAPAAFHVVALEIERAAFIMYAPASGEMLVMAWDPTHGLKETRRPYP